MSASVGFGRCGQQRGGRHDLPGLAVAALGHVQLLPGLLQRVGAVGRQPFDRDDGGARRVGHRCLAGAHRAASQMDGAGAARAGPAPVFRAGRFNTSRSTQSSGMSPGTSTVVAFPLTVKDDGHLAGAMSTAELGLSLAEMIRRGKVHAITCTGANLEEDVFNLVAHDHYVRIPLPRPDAGRRGGAAERHLNRVTDTCIPEEEAIRRIEHVVLEDWLAADARASATSRTSSCTAVLRSGASSRSTTRSIRRTAGWWPRRERPADHRARLGGLDARQHLRRHCIDRRDQERPHGAQRHRVHDAWLADWYKETVAGSTSIGFFQIGGGIAGDFPICVVPMLEQDLRMTDAALGLLLPDQRFDDQLRLVLRRVPNEKITWGKLGPTRRSSSSSPTPPSSRR
jgi:deoxyhypusine synthase